ncbi:hypothetical protein [Caulobacter sp.]|uniref:hypothetical protein n=1 Tax=Caulobacter sp. TaxID=78 RepID=UPI0031D0E3FF
MIRNEDAQRLGRAPGRRHQYRLVEVLEHGWDLVVSCWACGLSERRSMAHFLGPWRQFLNANVSDIAARIRCPCGAQTCFAYEIAGNYAYGGAISDAFERRRVFIRTALEGAGLDPAAYGYPPLTGKPSDRQMPT